MSDFDGVAAIVTGGSAGIGRAVVEQLTLRGAKVAIMDLNPPEADSSSTAFFARADVGDLNSTREGVAQCVSALGSLDVVINNAGIGAQGQIGANSDEEWARVFSISVTGIARVTRSALPHLRASSCAAIVNSH